MTSPKTKRPIDRCRPVSEFFIESAEFRRFFGCERFSLPSTAADTGLLSVRRRFLPLDYGPLLMGAFSSLKSRLPAIGLRSHIDNGGKPSVRAHRAMERIGRGCAAVLAPAAFFIGVLGSSLLLPAAAQAGMTAKTVLILETLASKGSARAQYELAQRYEAADGVRKDDRLALSLYCRAARQDHADAAAQAGRMHMAGRGGVAKDEELGRAWLRKAAALGNADAGRTTRISADTKIRNPDRCEPPNLRWGIIRTPPAEVRAMVTKMAPTFGLDPDLVLAVIAVESGYRVDVVSNKNAMGLMQLIPETAERFGVTKPFDPEQNLRGGMKYLRWLLAYFDGNVTFALAGYNAGEGAVLQYKGIPPYRETQDYVVKVHSLYARTRHPFDDQIVRSAGLVTAKREEVAELSGSIRTRGNAKR